MLEAASGTPAVQYPAGQGLVLQFAGVALPSAKQLLGQLVAFNFAQQAHATRVQHTCSHLPLVVLPLPAGVGKTAIVEGLAQRIIAGDVPPGLMGSALLELDLAALAAGCMMPGEFEVRSRHHPQ